MSNIHTIDVASESAYLELYQFDSGQIIEFVETTVADGSHVLFGGPKTNKAYRRIVENGKVAVPNKLLRKTGKIQVTVETLTENSETTIYDIAGYVKRRQEGGFDVEPEDEPTIIEVIFNKLKELAESVADLFRNKADKSSVYTKDETDSKDSATLDSAKSYTNTIALGLGNDLVIDLNTSTYILTLTLKHGEEILATRSVDLPLESTVIDGTYDSVNKKIILTLQSGQTLDIPIGDLVSGLVSTETFNNGMATKVDEVQSENNELTLTDNTETSEISVSDYSFLSFNISSLETDDVLTMYYKIGNTWNSKTISHDSWYEFVYEYDAIKFKVVTTPSSETREFKYSLYNDVIRQRQYSREIGALQRGKQNVINASNKLNADYIQNGTTNKTVTQQEKTFWNNRCRVFDAVYSNGSLNVKVASYPKIKENDLIVCNGNNIEAELDGAYLKRVVAVSIGPDADEIALTDIKETYSIQGTPPATAEWGVDFIYQVGNILLSENGNIYYCASATYNGDTETFTYTWQTYNISGKQDVIDSNNKLDADLLDDSTSTKKLTTQTEKDGWDAKEDPTEIENDTTSTTVSLTLENNAENRYKEELTDLTIILPQTIDDDFISGVVFKSGSTPTTMTYDSSIKWTGDDVNNNVFVPAANKAYDFIIWNNGIYINAIVRGVS